MCLANLHVARGIAGGSLRTMLRRRRSPVARRAVAFVAAGLCAFALAACGDDQAPQATAPALTGASDPADAQEQAPATPTPSRDEPASDPASDRTAIRATIGKVLGGSDPKQVCGPLVTHRYLRRSYGDAAGCMRAQSKQARADAIDIGDIAISPEAVASTSVRVKGGLYDRERLRAELVLQDGNWKLDSLRSNVPVGP